MRRIPACSILPALLPALLAIGSVAEAGRVIGYARHPKILDADRGYINLYEYDVWLTRQGEGGGTVAYRVDGNGQFQFTMPAGTYSLFLHQPEWHLRPAVRYGIQVETFGDVRADITPALDYAMSVGDFHEWGAEPWQWAATWHQTFIARGTSITMVEFKMAGTNTSAVNVSIHADSGSANPEEWPQVGPTGYVSGVAALNDNWVAWRSGEVPVEPGARYAVRLHDADGDAGMGILVHADRLGNNYEGGTAYSDGTPRDFDLHLLIGADSDGILIPYTKRQRIKPSALTTLAKRWGQSWRAMGSGLAAIDLFAADGNTGQFPVDVRIQRGGPDGEQVGPTKRGFAVWWGPGTGIIGVSYQPGEVVLVPGATYYVDMQAVGAAAGFNPYRMTLPRNQYEHGEAFRDGVAAGGLDLDMTILEYAPNDSSTLRLR